MCPEPEFGLFYHRLIEYYRPSPEASSEQLVEILEQHFAQKHREPQTDKKYRVKGGERT